MSGTVLLPAASDGGFVPVSSTQGGTPGNPALTQQWQFQAANTTNVYGSGVFGSAFWPGTFGSPAVTETSWAFGYNSPHLSGYSASKPQAFFGILPDCGDTHGVQMQAVFNSPDRATCFPWRFVGQTDGTKTGELLFSLPIGDGSIKFGVFQSDGNILNYMEMQGLSAATASSPGLVTIGTSTNPLTVESWGPLLLGQRLTMAGTPGVGNSLAISVGGSGSPAGLNAAVYLNCGSGATSILSFGTTGTGSWRHQVGTSGNLQIYDVTNTAAAATFVPGSNTSRQAKFNAKLICYTSLVVGIAALARNATTGFLYLPTCQGTPTGTPQTNVGTAAAVYDTSDNKLYVYNGGWKSVVLS